MKKHILLSVLLVVTATLAAAQSPALRAMFYNTENLFDTIDAPATKDEEFLPGSDKRYSTARYNEKLSKLAKVIDAAFDSDRPDLIGLCEVENRAVVESLLGKAKDMSAYQIIHYESGDMRGIDNALAYNPDVLKVLEYGEGPVNLGNEWRETRKVLWALFEDTRTHAQLIAMVNHWPSRIGGTEESNWKRVKASEALQILIADLRAKHPKAQFIAMGDFNDTPTDESVAQLSDCTKKNSPCLVNTLAHLSAEGRGTCAYRDEWFTFDQILVSSDMNSKTGGYWVKENSGQPLSLEWMMYEDKKTGNRYPNRTYGGNRYYGGFSDHLPVMLVIYANQ